MIVPAFVPVGPQTVIFLKRSITHLLSEPPVPVTSFSSSKKFPVINLAFFCDSDKGGFVGIGQRLRLFRINSTEEVNLQKKCLSKRVLLTVEDNAYSNGDKLTHYNIFSIRFENRDTKYNYFLFRLKSRLVLCQLVA